MEDRLHQLRAARGEGVLQLYGDGAGLPGHPRQAEWVQPSDRPGRPEILLDRRDRGPRQPGGRLVQPRLQHHQVLRQPALVPHRRGGSTPAWQQGSRGEPPPPRGQSLTLTVVGLTNILSPRPASPSSTISTLTVSSGTTWPAIIRNPPSVSPGTKKFSTVICYFSICFHIYYSIQTLTLSDQSVLLIRTSNQ